MKQEMVEMKKTFNISHICMIALAIVLNIVGAQIALFLKLPIYLDCIGTVMIAALYGWFYAMIPNLLSGLIFGMTTDIYSLYFAPVGMLLGVLIAIVWNDRLDRGWYLLGAAFLVTLPTSLCSACISAWLFGGITSSGSSVLQLLAKTPLSLTVSCFIVQFCTDFLDRLLSLFLVRALWKKLPERYRHLRNQ